MQISSANYVPNKKIQKFRKFRSDVTEDQTRRNRRAESEVYSNFMKLSISRSDFGLQEIQLNLNSDSTRMIKLRLTECDQHFDNN